MAETTNSWQSKSSIGARTCASVLGAVSSGYQLVYYIEGRESSGQASGQLNGESIYSSTYLSISTTPSTCRCSALSAGLQSQVYGYVSMPSLAELLQNCSSFQFQLNGQGVACLDVCTIGLTRTSEYVTILLTCGCTT